MWPWFSLREPSRVVVMLRIVNRSPLWRPTTVTPPCYPSGRIPKLVVPMFIISSVILLWSSSINFIISWLLYPFLSSMVNVIFLILSATSPFKVWLSSYWRHIVISGYLHSNYDYHHIIVIMSLIVFSIETITIAILSLDNHWWIFPFLPFMMCVKMFLRSATPFLPNVIIVIFFLYLLSCWYY